MTTPDSSLALTVAVPLLGALLTAVWPTRAPTLGMLSSLASAAAGLWTVGAVWQHGTLRAELGGWGAPLGIALTADGLSAAFVLLTALVGTGIAVYASGCFRQDARARYFWPLWLLLWTALNGLWLAADAFNLYVTLELLGLSAAALGALGGTRAAIAANLRYLLVGLLGSLTWLLGVALLYAAHGTLDLGQLAAVIVPGPVAGAALALTIGGLALKAALFPLHFWLPPAHASAPAPVSAALSALVVKAAVYLALRLWLELFHAATTPLGAALLGTLGAAAVLWGSWRALRAARLKLLAAYSTVAQMGYLFLFFPLLQALPAGAERERLLGALVLMALSHGCAKASLFLAAGSIQHHAGHDRIDALGGTAQHLPATTFAFGLAGTALIGLPPSGAFLGKWLLLESALRAGQWWWAPPILGGSLLAAGYVFRVLSRAFNREPTPRRFVTDARAELPALALALVAALALGLGAQFLWRLLGIA